MNVSIMQPTFVPWLGYFDLMKSSDIFVLLDSVKISKQSWQTRNVFNLTNGPQWLSVPISSSQCSINETTITNYDRFMKKLKKL